MIEITQAPAAGGFDEVVLPHLDAAYRLALWLVRNEHDAEDVVQDAVLKALRYFRTFAGGNGRAWFLQIVRNTCWAWLQERSQVPSDPFDEEQHSEARPIFGDPEALLRHTDDVALIERAMQNLPDRFRALLVLRELEELSYRELADVLEVPIGTIMSGLSRARQAFRVALDNEAMRSGGSLFCRRPAVAGHERWGSCRLLKRPSEQPGDRLRAIRDGICQALSQRQRHYSRQSREVVVLQIADQHDRMTRSVD